MSRLTLVRVALTALVLLTGCASAGQPDGGPLPTPPFAATQAKKPTPLPEQTVLPEPTVQPKPTSPIATPPIPTGPPDTGADSGIEGQVLIGPMCPVMREDQPCPDQPYQAVITVLGESGREVTRVESDALGNFRVSLAPGAYTLRPEPGEGIARAGEQAVAVNEGQLTQVVVTYDSGIR